jgi:hypothetical protein
MRRGAYVIPGRSFPEVLSAVIRFRTDDVDRAALFHERKEVKTMPVETRLKAGSVVWGN